MVRAYAPARLSRIARTSADRRGGKDEPAAAQAASIRVGMSPWRETPLRLRRSRPPCRSPAPRLGEPAAPQRSVLAPRSPRLVEQPQTHHVMQVAPPAIYPTLIGETVTGPPRPGSRLEFYPYQRPRTTRDVGKVVADRGTRPPPMRCHGPDERDLRRAGRPVASAIDPRRVPSTEPAPGCPAGIRSRPTRVRDLYPSDLSGVEQAGRRGVRPLCSHLSGEPIAEQVRDEQHAPNGTEGRVGSAAS